MPTYRHNTYKYKQTNRADSETHRDKTETAAGVVTALLIILPNWQRTWQQWVPKHMQSKWEKWHCCVIVCLHVPSPRSSGLHAFTCYAILPALTLSLLRVRVLCSAATLTKTKQREQCPRCPEIKNIRTHCEESTLWKTKIPNPQRRRRIYPTLINQIKSDRNIQLPFAD